jgi:glutamyl-tRNA synthetase
MVHVRIAPSPTGDPHVGTAYQALFNYVFAQQHKGKFIVRIEDTDQNRLVEGAQQRILDMLEWLGLPPDESPAVGGPNAPYVQSERLERHHAYARQLLQAGKAYRSFETPKELEQMRQEAEQEGQSYRGYDRRYRDLEPQEAQRRADAGEPHTLRLKVPLEGHTVVQDLLRGAVTFKNSELDDKVLVKSDGFPTYHLAAMCDDHDMGITHVIRAEEWLVSTPIHIQIYRAFGWEEPQWIHTPWLLGADHKKLSKRTGDVSVESYRARGFLPEALINYLGMMGFSMPDQREIFGVQDLITHFSWDRVSLGGSIFDIEKLKWLNGKYIREVLTLEDLTARIWAFSPPAAEKPENFGAVVKMMAPRLETLADFLPKTAYFWSEALTFTEKALQTLEAGKAILGELLPQLEALETFDPTSTHDLFAAFAAEKGLKLGKIMPPLRAAVAGTLESPDMGSLLEALGKERVLARVQKALETSKV